MPKSGHCPTCGHIIALSAEKCGNCGEMYFSDSRKRSKTCEMCQGDGIFPKEAPNQLPSYCGWCGGDGELSTYDSFDLRTGKMTRQGELTGRMYPKQTPPGHRKVVRGDDGRLRIESAVEPRKPLNPAMFYVWMLLLIALVIGLGVVFHK